MKQLRTVAICCETRRLYDSREAASENKPARTTSLKNRRRPTSSIGTAYLGIKGFRPSSLTFDGAR
jgi:hypothetical protein